MNKEFIPFEQSKILKHDLDYSGESLGWYNINKELYFGKDVRPYEDFNFMYPAPTFSQAFRWFREKYGLYSEIFVDDNKTFGFLITSFLEEGRLDKPIRRQFDSYEEAELGCVKQLILIIERKAEAYQ